jgi:hypothetical protein
MASIIFMFEAIQNSQYSVNPARVLHSTKTSSIIISKSANLYYMVMHVHALT